MSLTITIGKLLYLLTKWCSAKIYDGNRIWQKIFVIFLLLTIFHCHFKVLLHGIIIIRGLSYYYTCTDLLAFIVIYLTYFSNYKLTKWSSIAL